MWPGWVTTSSLPVCINVWFLLQWHWAGKTGWEVGFSSTGFSFPGGRRKPLWRRIISRPEQPLSPTWAPDRSSCAQEVGVAPRVGCCSNYNHASHLNALAEAAACASDMLSCFCFSCFLSWQVSSCPPLALAFPRWLGRESLPFKNQAESKSCREN